MRFRLVDKITALTPGRSIEGVKAVSFEEYRLKRRLGADDALPAPLLLEAVLQLGNWLIIASTDFTRMALVARLRRVTFPRPVGRGECVRMKVDILSLRPEGALLEGVGFVGDEEVMRGEGCVATFTPLGGYEDGADLRVVFEEIAPGVSPGVCPELMDIGKERAGDQRQR